MACPAAISWKLKEHREIVDIAHIMSSYLQFYQIEMYLVIKQRLNGICILIGLTVVAIFFRRETILTILKRNISPAKL